LNVIAGTADSGYAGFNKLPVGTLFTPPMVTEADVGLDNTFVSTAPQNGFVFQIQSSSVRLNSVPEPSSLICFIGLAAVGLKFRRRRA
jgi:hypothetical protein